MKRRHFLTSLGLLCFPFIAKGGEESTETQMENISIIGKLTFVEISIRYAVENKLLNKPNVHVRLMGEYGSITLMLKEVAYGDAVELHSNLTEFIRLVPRDIFHADFYGKPLFKYKNYDVIIASYILEEHH